MRVEKPENVVKQVLKDIICNICQNTTRRYGEYEFVELFAVWGYGTKRDLTTTQAHICEDCYDQHIVPLLAIPAEKAYNLSE